MKTFKIWIACIALLFGQLALGQSRNLDAYTDSLIIQAQREQVIPFFGGFLVHNP